MIKRENGKYYLYSKDGSKKLGGPYNTRAAAVHREKQVVYFKNKAKGDPVPKGNAALAPVTDDDGKPIGDVVRGGGSGVIPKSVANYVLGAAVQTCSTCSMFMAPNGCSYVAGEIDGDDGHCDSYFNAAQEDQPQTLKAKPKPIERSLLGIRAHTTGEFRTEQLMGRDYLVVPVVALVEGVLQGVTADHPELALAEEFGKYPAGWNGRPIVMDHPEVVVDNQAYKVSANSPAMLEKYAFGYTFNTKVEDKSLVTEAWIDKERAATLNDQTKTVLQHLEAGEAIEVSTGLFTGVISHSGKFNGKDYNGIWSGVVPDHLAFLPDGHVGACSINDGCGAARQNASYEVLRANCGGVEGCNCGCDMSKTNKIAKPAGAPANATFQPAQPPGAKPVVLNTQAAPTVDPLKAQKKAAKKHLISLVRRALSAPDDMLHDDVRDTLQKQIQKAYPNDYPYVVGTNNDKVIYSATDENNNRAYFQRGYTIDGEGGVALADDVQEVNLATKVTPIKEPDADEVSASSKAGNPADPAATSTETSMTDKTKPTEQPAANASAPKPGEAATTAPATVAAQAAPAAQEQPKALSAADWLSQAPAEIRESVESGMRLHQARKTQIIKSLIDTKRCKFNEQQLQAKPLDELEMLADLANVPTFEGLNSNPQPVMSVNEQNTGFAPAPPKLIVNNEKPAA